MEYKLKDGKIYQNDNALSLSEVVWRLNRSSLKSKMLGKIMLKKTELLDRQTLEPKNPETYKSDLGEILLRITGEN